MSIHERLFAESTARVAEKKRAFDEGDLAHHRALCSRDADLMAIQLAASRVHTAACALSLEVGLHLMALDRLKKSNRGEAA